MEHMETIAFIHVQKIARTVVVTPILATVLVVSQDTRVQYVIMVLFKNKLPFNACFGALDFVLYLLDFFSNFKNQKNTYWIFYR